MEEQIYRERRGITSPTHLYYQGLEALHLPAKLHNPLSRNGVKTVREVLIFLCSSAQIRNFGALSRAALGGKQRMAIINEPGLYSVILCSRKPEAKAFKRWITHEVIPAIRKYGGYMTKSLLEQVLENPNLIYEFARRMLAEQQKNERLKQELDRAKPKADYYDAFIHPESCTNIRATAKELKVPEKMFTAFLIRKRYLYRAPSGSLMPYAKAADDGLFFVKDYIAVNGHQGVYTLVTPKGKALFLSMLGEIA